MCPSLLCQSILSFWVAFATNILSSSILMICTPFLLLLNTFMLFLDNIQQSNFVQNTVLNPDFANLYLDTKFTLKFGTYQHSMDKHWESGSLILAVPLCVAYNVCEAEWISTGVVSSVVFSNKFKFAQ